MTGDLAGELAHDPVFGAVARALSPRCIWIGRVADESGHGSVVDIAVRTAGITPQTFAFTEDRPDIAFQQRPGRLGQTVVRCAANALGVSALIETDTAAWPLGEACFNRRSPVAAPRFLGVVNVTPDSFSDGGAHLDPSRAVEHALALVAEGADLLDVGGESTRPRAEPVAVDEELRRVVPVIAALARHTRVPISVDTTKSAVARAALDAGATIVNDVSAGRFDPAMFAVVAERRAGYVAMHMQGDPRTMQVAPHYEDVVADVTDFLRERCFRALDAGVPRAGLWIDPGIGFGKTAAHNLELLRRLGELRSLGLPILLGVSRKSFIPAVSGIDHAPAQRLGGTAAAIALGVAHGAEIVRVHDVAVMREAALVARAIAGDDAADAPA
jgi:dihydropteroate synthase